MTGISPAVSELVRFEYADQAGEALIQALPFGRRQALEQEGVGLLEGAADVPGEFAALSGEIEPVEAPVGGVAFAGEPAVTFQVGGQAADRALLEVEPFAELLLGQGPRGVWLQWRCRAWPQSADRGMENIPSPSEPLRVPRWSRKPAAKRSPTFCRNHLRC